MSQFEIPKSFPIPYFDHGKNLNETIKNSSKRRHVNRLIFVFRKMRNIILFWLAWACPLNSWRVKMHRWRGCHIGENVYIGLMCSIDNAYPDYVFLEDESSLAGEVTVVAHSNPYKHFEGVIEAKVNPVVVRRGAWVGVKSTLLGGSDVGEYAIVSAGSVVSNKVPAYTMVVGNPAKKVYNYEHIINKKQQQYGD